MCDTRLKAERERVLAPASEILCDMRGLILRADSFHVLTLFRDSELLNIKALKHETLLFGEA